MQVLYLLQLLMYRLPVIVRPSPWYCLSVNLPIDLLCDHKAIFNHQHDLKLYQYFLNPSITMMSHLVVLMNYVHIISQSSTINKVYVMLGINGLLKMSFAEFNGRNMYFWKKTEN